MNLETIQIDGETVCVSGVGRMFFENGLPIGITVSEMAKKGIKVSLLNLADELIKNGWKPKTVTNRIISDFNDSGIILDDATINLLKSVL